MEHVGSRSPIVLLIIVVINLCSSSLLDLELRNNGLFVISDVFFFCFW